MILIRSQLCLIILLLVSLCQFRAAAQAPNGAWVYPSATGNLLYQLDSRGQRITDFSQCGYRGGTEPLPNVSALIPQSRWVYVSPGAGDDTALVQAAIDSVEAFTPDANGWRGVVYLNAGEYQLATTLTIPAAQSMRSASPVSKSLCHEPNLNHDTINHVERAPFPSLAARAAGYGLSKSTRLIQRASPQCRGSRCAV